MSTPPTVPTPPTSTLAMYSQIVRTDGGVVTPIPDAASLVVPKGVIAITGKIKDHRTFVVPKRTPTSPQPDPTILWEWKPGMPFFQSALVRIRGTSGFVWIGCSIDKPTSDTDLAPLGTHVHEINEGLPCWGEFKKPSPYALGHPTLATAAGRDVDGFPSVFTDPAGVKCAVYKIWARADSTTNDVTLDVFVDG